MFFIIQLVLIIIHINAQEIDNQADQIQIIQCKENCIVCNETECLSCKKGYGYDKERKECEICQENDNENQSQSKITGEYQEFIIRFDCL